MKLVALLSRFGAVGVVLPLLMVGPVSLSAQTAPDVPAAKPASPEELNQAELLRSYLQVRDQLHATQLAVVNNRVEAETAARVQAAALAEKLDSIKAAMAAERDRHQVETQRLNEERERQQLEAQRSIRTVLWVAGTFGCLGLLAMLLMPLFQWRAINRMAEAAAGRPQLTGGHPPALPALEAGGPADHTVTLSNQRLMSVIERMERRIIELEQTAGAPLPTSTASRTESVPPVPTPTITVTSDVAATRHDNASAVSGRADNVTRTDAAPDVATRSGVASELATRIATLLGKARTLTTTNKAREAVAAYDEILALEPNHPEALLKKGAALERLMRNEEAIRCYDRAIEIDAKMTLAYLYKGGVCNRLGRYDDALECYEQAMQVQEAGK